MVFALGDPESGTHPADVLAFGAGMDRLDAELARRLEDARRGRRGLAARSP